MVLCSIEILIFIEPYMLRRFHYKEAQSTLITEISELTQVDESQHGVDIYRLSLAQKASCVVVPTLTISNEYFRNYVGQRKMDDDVIEALLERISSCKISSESELYLSCSFFKETLPPVRNFRTSCNFTSLKHAITKIYESWFDERALSYRLRYKIEPEHTYPTLYIQKFMPHIRSIVTHNPASGEYTHASNYDGIVHNKVNAFSKPYADLIARIDSCIPHPSKIHFVEEANEIKIIKISEYPMTDKAFYSSIISKYESSLLSGKELLMQISPDKIYKYSGYSLMSDEKFKADLPLSDGATFGKAVFTTTSLNSLKNIGDKNFILFGYMGPEDLSIFSECNGLIQSTGGMTSHGAVVSRGAGKPAILVGDMKIDPARKLATYYDKIIREFDYVAISANEMCWSLSGTFGPCYELRNITDNHLDCIIKLLNQYRVTNELDKHEIEFQMHIAKLVAGLRRAGIRYESIIR